MIMNNIDQRIKQLKESKEIGLMTHAVLGYPTMKICLDIINTLISNGSDFLELQIPFSDPVADGETIMKACEAALKNGTNTDKTFHLISKLTNRTNVPVLIMAYYNTVFRYGIDKFCCRASKLKASGLIVPDIPQDEEPSEKFITTCFKYDLYPIRIVSPSSSRQRLRANVPFAKGFVYCISHFGVTGSQVIIDGELFNYIERVKQVIRLPVAVGFGIERREQLEKLRGIVDIAIVGSAIIKNYNDGGIERVSSFIRKLKEGTI